MNRYPYWLLLKITIIIDSISRLSVICVLKASHVHLYIWGQEFEKSKPIIIDKLTTGVTVLVIIMSNRTVVNIVSTLLGKDLHIYCVMQKSNYP